MRNAALAFIPRLRLLAPDSGGGTTTVSNLNRQLCGLHNGLGGTAVGTIYDTKNCVGSLRPAIVVNVCFQAKLCSSHHGQYMLRVSNAHAGALLETLDQVLHKVAIERLLASRTTT